MSTSQPHFPTFQPNSSYSFYPYPLSGVSSTSSTLRGLVDPRPNRSTRSHPQPQASSQGDNQAGPSRDRNAEIWYAQKVRARAEKRAVVGMRPAGLAVGRESESLDMEEIRLEDEKLHTNMFGHRFLLPIGRRVTQMEMESAPSPTPSEPDERRQEDRLVGDPPTPLVGGDQGNQMPIEEDDDEEMVDLDGDMEDLDEMSGDEEVGDETMDE